MGTGNPILKDIKVRQAIALGINRDELVAKVLDGNGIVGAGYLPPGYPQFFWKPSASDSLDYDPARAKQMLDQAGYKMGPNGVRLAPCAAAPGSTRRGSCAPLTAAGTARPIAAAPSGSGWHGRSSERHVACTTPATG